MAGVGHNSGFAKDELVTFINRIERLEEEKAALGEDIKEVYSEAKDTGFDTKILRWLVSMRKLDKSDLQNRLSLQELYMRAAGMLD